MRPGTARVSFVVVSIVGAGLAAPPCSGATDGFSAPRAMQTLRLLLEDPGPRPMGSAAHAQMPARIADAFQMAGLAPQIQEDLVCRGGNCADVRNVVARVPGTSGGTSIVLCAHYDSVGASPGASDNLVNVAVLVEVARVISGEAPRRHSVLLLASDGEEAGLLGAEAFANRLRGQQAVVVNLDARGTTGSSLMFEAADGDTSVTRTVLRALPHPRTSSAYAHVYRRLPHDTDLTVFQARGWPGLNFAFIGGPRHYHTALDDLGRVDERSLGLQGANALAAVRALADSEPKAETGTDVFFDLGGLAAVCWSSATSTSLACLCVTLFLANVVRDRRCGLVPTPTLLRAAAAVVTALLLSMGAAALLALALAASGAFPASWVARPEPAMVAFAVLPFAMAAACARHLRFGATDAAVTLVAAGLWTTLAVGTSAYAVGFSYLFLVPVGAWTSARLARPAGAGPAPARLAFAVAFAALWVPVLAPLYDALGLAGLVATSLCLSLAAPWLPQDHWERRARTLSYAVTPLAALLAWLWPPFDALTPMRASLFYHQSDAGAEWLLDREPGTPPPTPTDVVFTAAPAARFPWFPDYLLYGASAPALGLPAPVLENVAIDARGPGRQIRARARSRRGAPHLRIAVRGDVPILTVELNGVRADTGGTRGPTDWSSYAYLTLPPAGVDLVLTLASSDPVVLTLVDSTPGLPAEGAQLGRARARTAVPFGYGDATVVSTRIRL